MLILHELHAATNVGAGINVMVMGVSAPLKTHTAEYQCSSGTGNATITHYGRNSDQGAWHAIWTYAFTGAANGDKAATTLEHAWENYKTECSVLTGTGGKVLSTMSGA